MDINDGIPSEVALPRITFVLFGLSGVELGTGMREQLVNNSESVNNSELVNILRPL